MNAVKKEESGRKGKILIFVAALFGALLLWLYAIGYDTEIDEQTFAGIPVEIIGMHSNGYTVAEAESFSQSIDVRASGTRAALNAVDAGDFSAYVDISTVDKPGLVTLPVMVVAPGGVTAASSSVANITLYVDVFTSRNINVQIEKTYSSAYEIGETVQSLYTVRVNGPESVIGSAEAYCSFALGDISGESVRVSGEIRLRNAETKAEISNPYVTVETGTVDVTFVLYGRKTVPVRLALTGGVWRAEDAQFLSSVPGVELRGPLSALEQVQSLSVRCDETLFTDNRLNGSVTAGELLEQNLPESGLSAVDPDAEISYSVVLPEVRYRKVTVPVSRISVYNLPTGGAVKVNVLRAVEVTVFGPADAVRAYDATDMTILVDYNTLEPQTTENEFLGTAEISTGSSAVCVDGSTYTVAVRVTAA